MCSVVMENIWSVYVFLVYEAFQSKKENKLKVPILTNI